MEIRNNSSDEECVSCQRKRMDFNELCNSGDIDKFVQSNEELGMKTRVMIQRRRTTVDIANNFNNKKERIPNTDRRGKVDTMTRNDMAHTLKSSGDHGSHITDHGKHNNHIMKNGNHAGMRSMHSMSMIFHGGFSETILFDSWKTSSFAGLVGSIIGIIVMAALYEGLKYYREYLFWKMYNTLQYKSDSMPQAKNVIHPTMFSWMHMLQTSLHIVQMIVSYFLMLIFMTYNVWLCFAVVMGAAIGYFLFGWKKTVIVDVTEHCH